MAHDNRDIAQEAAEDFLSNELWELVEECHEKNGWNEMYITKISKREAKKRLVRTHLAAYPVRKGMAEYLREAVGVIGSLCLYVKRTPKEIKHVWNLPYTKRGGLIIPDGCASSLVLDSVSKLGNGMKCIRPESYASLGFNA